MSYYSEKKYKEKTSGSDLWFERLYFSRWFEGLAGPILDIGCATGNFMAVRPEIFEGAETDEASIKIAKNRGLNVLRVDVNKEMHLFMSNKYTAVYAKQIIEHLNNPLNFLREIRRILKPGGRAVILTPNCPYMLGKTFWDDFTHKRPFTASALKMIAYDAGFSKIKIEEDFRCFPGLGKFMRLFNISPALVAKIQRLFFIRGLILILVVEKQL